MKGTLYKKEQGWVIEYLVDERTPVGHKSWVEVIPLHPKDVSTIIQYSDYSVDWAGKEVEFEIVKEYLNSHTNELQAYAKIIAPKKLNLSNLEKKLDDTLSNETPESTTKWLNNKRENSIDKDLFYHKQVMNPYPSESQSYTAYEKGFVEGYEKAKEILYTEEQVKKAINRAVVLTLSDKSCYSDEIIQLIKENKL